MEAGADKIFGPEWNIFRQMGTISFYLYWLIVVSGVYLYIYLDTRVDLTYQSVERISEQWWGAGFMRSIHRYAANAMVITAIWHMCREFIFDRYRDVRWFAWLTGVPILWFLYFSGISGYWLVWDQLAQYVALASMEWLDWLGIFGEPLANNFLTTGSLADRFMTVMLFMHISMPLILLFIMWVHVSRLQYPKINPPAGVAVGILGMLVVLSLLKPALSQGPADLSIVPASVDLSWFFMLFFPLIEEYGAGPLWIAMIGGSVFLALLPWMPPAKLPPPAVVDLEQCNGCSLCAQDCPFGAVQMHPRSDGRPYDSEAVVDPDLCISCGICVGACPMAMPFLYDAIPATGIDIPIYPLARARQLTIEAAEALAASADSEGGRILVFGCWRSADPKKVTGPNTQVVQLNCIGMLAPSLIDFAMSKESVDGVVLTACRVDDCTNRLGNKWMPERINGDRKPYLHDRVPRQRICVAWGDRTDTARLSQEIEAFRSKLKALPPKKKMSSKALLAEKRDNTGTKIKTGETT